MRLAHSAFLFLFIPAALGLAAAQPQGWSEEAKNLQYFPKGTKQSELIPMMRQFSFALGVPCTHCHGTREQKGFDLRGVDFSLDIKPTKGIARDMLRMVDEINSKLLTKIAPRSDLDLKVSCFTCHSGIPLPETIESRVLRMIEREGVKSAIEDYRSTRERYYGSAAYNFKEQPLVEVASDLLRQGKYQEAVEVSQLNLEFHPRSSQSKFRLAQGYEGLGDKDKARGVYKELLEANPNDRRVKERLEALEKPNG